ncbi:MAG: damage-control phosphatase ARMT1 family protein [Thermodesulfobacteriota bacterium]
MKTYYDCIPCFIRQTLEAVRFATSDEGIHESVLREVLAAVSRMDLSRPPPIMGQLIHRIIRTVSGIDDPYRAVKDRFNRHALALYPSLQAMVDESRDRFETAVRLAIAGNIIDFGVNAEIDDMVIQKTIESALAESMVGNVQELREAVAQARRILYLGDNTGEIVFDRLLLEQLPIHKVTYVVRGRPVINDATFADAVDTGLTKIIDVIDNGSDVPGTILSGCSEAFQSCFQEADVVIAKGQGNYETLSDSDKPIFFLLKAKCAVIARDLGCAVGSAAIARTCIRSSS